MKPRAIASSSSRRKPNALYTLDIYFVLTAPAWKQSKALDRFKTRSLRNYWCLVLW